MREEDFLSWYQKWAERTGLDPDPDDPRHHYDYRAAYFNGAVPVQNKQGEWHWPSAFKTKDHPNRYVNGVDTLMDIMRP